MIVAFKQSQSKRYCNREEEYSIKYCILYAIKMKRQNSFKCKVYGNLNQSQKEVILSGSDYAKKIPIKFFICINCKPSVFRRTLVTPKLEYDELKLECGSSNAKSIQGERVK